MSYSLQGQRVSGIYQGVNHVNGTVTASRLGHDGSIWHTVLLDQPRLFGHARRTHVIVFQQELTYVGPPVDQNFD